MAAATVGRKTPARPFRVIDVKWPQAARTRWAATQMLDVLGLSAAEQAMYEAIVTRAATTLDDALTLRAELGLDAATDIPALLHGLVARGLLTVDPQRQEYAATPPAEALERLLVDRVRDLTAARLAVLELEAQHRRAGAGPPEHAPAPAVEIVHGADEVRRRFFQLQNEAPPGEVRGTERPPYLAVPDDPNDTVRDLLETDLTYRIIYDPRALDLAIRPYHEVLDVSDGRRVRMGSVPTKLVLTDQPAALLPLDPDVERQPAAMVVRHPTLLALLSLVFELYWQRSIPLNVRPDSGESERALLPFLVAGLTDAEIAAKLGWSHRTVRRRIKELMTSLGATTRFSAGYEAVRRGWLEDNDGSRGGG